MTDYVEILDSRVDQDSPVTVPLMTQLRDNPKSMIEGVNTGAPVNAAAWHPYDAVTIGDGADGVFYSFADDGSATAIETPYFEDGYEYAVLFVGLWPLTSNATLQAYNETSSAWSADAPNVATPGLSNSGFVELLFPRLSRLAHRVSGGTTGFTSIADMWTFTTSGKIRNLRVNCSGGTSAGKLQLYRRVSYQVGV